jgi:hypothetical protein
MFRVEHVEPGAPVADPENTIVVKHIKVSELESTETDLNELGEPPPEPEDLAPEDEASAFEFIDGLMCAFSERNLPEEGHVIQLLWPDDGGSLLIWPGDPQRWIEHQHPA